MDDRQWTQELEKRLREDLTYGIWKKGAEKIEDRLMSLLPERERDMVIDYGAALNSMQAFAVEYAYELGAEHGLAKARKGKR